MTKGDMYTKEIFKKILDEGCLDKDPRPHYEDVYKGAIYDVESNTIISLSTVTITFDSTSYIAPLYISS